MRRLTGAELALLGAVALLLWSVAGDCRGRAQAAPRRPVLTLAISIVAEAGFAGGDDWPAMLHTLGRRAADRRMRVDSMARAYCAVWRTERPRTAWLLGLNLRADRPPAWPPGLSWAPSRARWRLALQTARAYLAGRLADPCAHDPGDHFGGPMDAPDPRWAPACSGVQTRQLYWRSGAGER